MRQTLDRHHRSSFNKEAQNRTTGSDCEHVAIYLHALKRLMGTKFADREFSPVRLDEKYLTRQTKSPSPNFFR